MKVNNLNSKYTFDNFLIGNNKFAYDIALEVANSPANAFSPLYIFGERGQGKTHLMQAVGNKILQDNPDFKICYMRTDELVKEIINSIKESDDNKSFLNEFNNIDVLLIDDIQLMAGQEECQDIFRIIFNRMHESGKLIIIVGDKYPIHLNGISNRLQTRFCWGVSVKLLMPYEVEE